MELQKTINYFQFKKVAGNRPVDQRHVNEIVEAIRIKNLLHLFPILVNSAFEIIDGQHRLAAAEFLGLYVYYIVSDDISKSDIGNVNAHSKNWNINDYINYWTVQKKEGFDVLSQFMIDNPLIPPSTVLMMMSRDYKRDLNRIREGRIDVSNHEFAVAVSDIVKKYFNLIPFAYERNFVLAVMKCLRTPGYDHNHMESKLEYQRKSLYRCVNVKQYTEMLADIYNHSLTQKNHLKVIA